MEESPISRRKVAIILLFTSLCLQMLRMFLSETLIQSWKEYPEININTVIELYSIVSIAVVLTTLSNMEDDPDYDFDDDIDDDSDEYDDEDYDEYDEDDYDEYDDNDEDDDDYGDDADDNGGGEMLIPRRRSQRIRSLHL